MAIPFFPATLMAGYQRIPPPASGKKIAGLDHLRAVAISVVFFYHYRQFGHPAWLDHVGQFGWTGVDLFFVLSGFLIAGQLFSHIEKQHDLGLKEFYIKRIFRILPVYFLILLLYICIPGFKEKDGMAPLWKYWTFTLNFGLDLSKTHAFTHAWSLCVEEQFYFFLPLILWCFVRWKKLGWAVYLLPLLFAAGLLVRAFCWLRFVSPISGQEGEWHVWYQYLYYPTYSRLDGLLTGIALAAFCQYKPWRKERILRYGNLLLAGGLCLLTVAYFICQNQTAFSASLFGYPCIAIAYGLVVLAVVSPSCFLYRINTKITGPLAILSYSLYLSHKEVIHLTHEGAGALGMDQNGNWMFVLSAVMSLLGALFLRYAVEKPFLRIRDRLLRKNSQGTIKQRH